jgi:hypothetical protein
MIEVQQIIRRNAEKNTVRADRLERCAGFPPGERAFLARVLFDIVLVGGSEAICSSFLRFMEPEFEEHRAAFGVSRWRVPPTW